MPISVMQSVLKAYSAAAQRFANEGDTTNAIKYLRLAQDMDARIKRAEVYA